MVKVNVNVPIWEDFAVVVAIIRDHQGAIRGFKVDNIDAVTPLVGEAEAANMGVDLAHQEGFTQIILEGESEVVIKAIQQFPQQTDWWINHMVLEILTSLRLMQFWKVSHIRRSANKVLHQLARWAATEIISGGNLCTYERFPELDWLYAGTDPP